MNDKIKNTIENLKKHNINCIFVKDENAAREKVLELIPYSSSVGLGGSMSVHYLNVIPELEKRNLVHNPYTPEGKKDPNKNQQEIRRKGLASDFFLTGSNSLTEDGYLVNMDGTGNRVAAMAFGPKKLILVVGKNKIVEDIDEAFDRIKKIAAPQNARRHGWDDIPCFHGGCVECASSHRQCNNMLVTYYSRDPKRITVILVDKDLGF
jgi:hypothetical protein